MNKEIIIYIPKEELADLNSLMKGDAVIVSEHTIATHTAKFSNGIEADIKVCGVKSTDEDESAYIDAVLFKNGSEVCCLEPSFDTLDGEYIFDDPDNQGDTLTVLIKESILERSE